MPSLVIRLVHLNHNRPPQPALRIPAAIYPLTCTRHHCYPNYHPRGPPQQHKSTSGTASLRPCVLCGRSAVKSMRTGAAVSFHVSTVMSWIRKEYKSSERLRASPYRRRHRLNALAPTLYLSFLDFFFLPSAGASSSAAFPFLSFLSFFFSFLASTTTSSSSSSSSSRFRFSFCRCKGHRQGQQQSSRCRKSSPHDKYNSSIANIQRPSA